MIYYNWDNEEVCGYLCDKNTKMKTTEFDIDKIFQISCKIA